MNSSKSYQKQIEKFIGIRNSSHQQQMEALKFDQTLQLQNDILILTDETYPFFLDSIKKSSFFFGKFEVAQLLFSMNTLFKINDQISNLCIKLVKDLYDIITKFFTMSEIFNLFQKNKAIVFALLSSGLLDRDELKSYFAPNSFEYDFYINTDNIFEKERGINHHEIAIYIRKDDLDSFQSLISRTNVNVNSRVPFSIFERFPLLNSQTTLIEFAVFFGSINIFKFLIMQGALLPPQIGKYAAAGGNYDIIHILEEKGVSFDGCINIAIAYFRDDLVKYFKQTYELNIDSLVSSIINYNVKYIVKLLKRTKNINQLGLDGNQSPLHAAADHGYLDIVQYLCYFPNIDVNIRIPNLLMTPLHMAAANGHLDVVKYLCQIKDIDINAEQRILFIFFFIVFFSLTIFMEFKMEMFFIILL